MFYDRAIHYLNLYRDGEKGEACGYLKLEQKDNVLTYYADFNCRSLGECKAYFLQSSGNMMLGEATMRDGKAVLTGSFLTEEGTADSHFDGMVIEGGDGDRIQSIWRDRDADEVTAVSKRAEPVPITTVSEAGEEMEQHRKEGAGETEAEKDLPRKELYEDHPDDAMEALKEPDNADASKNEISETKWEQLWKIYPHRTPFGDKREFLVCGPADFVLLSEESYQKATNTFLMHGFYTYGYLLLGKKESRGKTQYYLAVPGTFVEKESKIAIYYGFDSFETMKEPAEIGDFGYFCLPVSL